jgi:hypothetical protein
MKISRLLALAAPAALAVSSFASGQTYIVVPDSGADRIMLFDSFNGSLVNPAFITDAGGTPFDFGTPKDAIQVNNELWVSDQISDAIFRFDLSGNYVATVGGGPTGGLDNIRGMAFANNQVYVTNDGSANGATVNTVYRFSTTGALLGSFTAGNSPFDVYDTGTELLVSDSTDDDIDRYSYAGAFLGNLVPDSLGGGSFFQQINNRSNGNLIVGVFSTTSGVYEYTAAGAFVARYALGLGQRGVVELGNGNIFYTYGSNAAVLDPGTGISTIVFSATGASLQYANLFTIPEPGSVSLLALAALAAVRRTRKA